LTIHGSNSSPAGAAPFVNSPLFLFFTVDIIRLPTGRNTRIRKQYAEVINICFRAILGCWRTCACYDMLSSWALGRQTNQSS
jgi:hypothetical protein